VVRSALYTLWLAWTRLSRRGGAVALSALGVGAGAAVVAAVLAGTTVAQDRSVAQAVERIPDAARSVRAVWFGVPAADERYGALDARARSALAPLGLGTVPLVLYRESTLGGAFAGLGGVERLGRWVTLLSGRLPRACVPQRCEVLRLRGEGRLPALAGLRLVEVGEASLASRLLFGDFLAATDNALANAAVSPLLRQAVQYHRPPPAPLFLAEGVDAIATAPSLAASYRSYAWVAPLGPGRPRLWEVDALAAGIERSRSELGAASLAFDLAAPVQELRAAQAAAGVAGGRLRLVGGQAAALLFAFAVLAALSARRDLAAARRRLSWYGARSWQLALLTGAEAAVVAVVGAVAGFAAGVAAGAIAAERAGAPVGAVLAHGPLAGRGLLAAAGVAIVAAVVLAAATSVRAVSATGLALGAAALAALAAALASGGVTGTLLLPGLVSFAAALLVASVLRPALRLLERAVRGRGTAVRLAAVSLAGNPGYAVVTTAFLVVSFGLALFAEGYRATIARGEADQAAFAVPRDFVVREDLTRLVPVLDAAPLERFARLGNDVAVDPVVRLTGGISRLEGGTGITVVGLPPEALPELRGWRDDTAAGSPDELAARIAVPDATLAGVDLPAGRLRLPVGHPQVKVILNVETVRGAFLALAPGDAVPAGSRLVALTLDAATRLQDRGADAGRALAATVELGPLSVGGTPVDESFAGWIGVNGAQVVSDGDALTVRVALTNTRVTRVRPRQALDDQALPVLATRRLAAAAGAGGVLVLQVGGEQLTARVAGVLNRFPTVRGEAVVADGSALATALNSVRPGAARVNELWVGVPGDERAAEVGAALARAPFHVLAVDSRRALEEEAGRDPIAHGTLLILGAAALVALLLALVGMLLTVVGDLRDERGELFDLEAQGVGPRQLRRLVRLRALAVAAAGLVFGALAGAVLAAAVTDLVAVTARGAPASGVAVPPLRFALDWWVVLAAAALYGLAAAALVGLATRRAFPAGGAPARATELGA
jgi:hypothetical protein